MRKGILSRWLQNQSLRRKMIYIVIFSCFLLLSVNYVVLQMAYRAYDEQLYNKTAQVFATRVEQIEIELKKMDGVTLAMIGDANIQENLTLLRELPKYSLEQQQVKKSVGTSLRSYMYDIDYFQMVEIVVPDLDITIGDYGTLKEEKKQVFAEIAIENRGAPEIIVYENSLYYLRLIREMKNFAFTPLGIIIGEINLQKLIDISEENDLFGGIKPKLAVIVEEICVYRESEEIQPMDTDGWEIQGDYFVVQYTNNRGWKFLMGTPHDSILDSIRAITISSFLWFAISAVLVLIIAYFLVGQISNHLGRLMKKIDAYGKGELPSLESMEDYAERRDEIGRLHRHFDRMAYEYKRLNEENYNRMLLQKETQYKQLQQQIQPHFIFNTLSLITWKAYESEDTEVAKLTNALSRMMWQTMSFNEKTVTVKDELKFVEDYMLIQQMRFKHKLKFELDVPDELGTVRIPQMTIQPIVENAVKYALEEMLETCVIRVSGRRETERVVLIVEDNGPGIDEDIIRKLETGEVEAEGSGIGLRNIQKRLQLVFSEQYGLEFHRVEEHTEVWICLPSEEVSNV